MITLNGALEQYCCHNYNFDRTQIILYFGCTNNIFTIYILKLQLYGVKCKLDIPFIYISYNPLRCTRLWCNSNISLIQMTSHFIPFKYLSLEVVKKEKERMLGLINENLTLFDLKTYILYFLKMYKTHV